MVRGKDSYADWAGQVTDFEGIAFVHLNEIVASRFEDLGPEKVDGLLADAHTHTSEPGAIVNAEAAVTGLRSLPGDPLAVSLQNEGR